MQLFRYLFKNKEKQIAPRSVVFYRQSYYHFYYLSKALRKRGWDAIVVNLEPIDGLNSIYYHGEDINLYHPDPLIFNKKINDFYQMALTRFKLMHFAGDGYLSFFPEQCNEDQPQDVIGWKKANNKIAYTVSGCNSGVSQTSVSLWSLSDNLLNVCDRCIWQNNAEVCNDKKNLNWGKKVKRYCDLIFTEISPALDYMSSAPNVFRDPVTTCLDSTVWSPDLSIPEECVIPKEKDEVLIYHSVGNYDTRSSDLKNIKGTPFVYQAVERLKKEGYNVRMVFVTNKPNLEVRYYQLQADIVVDQLNYGRYGANARESMMLGKPVICYLNRFEYKETDQLVSLNECPIVSASEETLYDELKKLVVNSELRKKLGKQGREYALKWHDADACAERYEQIYDQFIA